MANAIEIDGKNLLPIREAVRLVSYSRDYITRLAREGKIVAVQVGRQWYIDDESLRNYEAESEREAAERKRQLSEERRRELETRVAVEARLKYHDVKHGTFHTRAMVASLLIMAAGLLSGYTTYWLMNYQGPAQMAGGGFAVRDAALPQSTPEPVIPTSAPVPNVTRSAGVVEVATTTLEMFADPDEAVVLLPRGEMASVSDMFSDQVQIRTDENGRYVELVNEAGEVVASPVPFVVVPVATSSDEF